jgi:hypothetical protein
LNGQAGRSHHKRRKRTSNLIIRHPLRWITRHTRLDYKSQPSTTRSITLRTKRLTDQTEQVPPAILAIHSKSILGPLFPLDELRSFGAGEALREVLDVIHSALDVF